MSKNPSGLKIEDLILGTGPEAKKGAHIKIHYLSKLNRGDVFQNTYDAGIPIQFRIGRREVIAGLEKGIIGMGVGGKRRILVGPHLAYRDKGVPGIPPNALLIFEVELVEVAGLHDK